MQLVDQQSEAGWRPGDEQVRGGHRDGVRRVRRRPGRRGRRRGRPGRALGRHQRRQRAGRRDHADRRRPRRLSRRHHRGDRRREGRHHHQAGGRPACATDTVAVIGRQVPEAMEVLLAQAVRADAAVAREDSEFAVLGRQVAVGGQLLRTAGPRRRVLRHLPAAARRASGAQRGGRAGGGRGVLRRRRGATARHRRGPGGFRRRHQPGPAGTDAHRANGVHRRGPQPGRRRRAGAGPAGGVRLPVPGRCGLGDGRQGRRRHPRPRSSRCSTRSW